MMTMTKKLLKKIDRVRELQHEIQQLVLEMDFDAVQVIRYDILDDDQRQILEDAVFTEMHRAFRDYFAHAA
jgi:hypothetical protein